MAVKFRHSHYVAKPFDSLRRLLPGHSSRQPVTDIGAGTWSACDTRFGVAVVTRVKGKAEKPPAGVKVLFRTTNVQFLFHSPASKLLLLSICVHAYSDSVRPKTCNFFYQWPNDMPSSSNSDVMGHVSLDYTLYRPSCGWRLRLKSSSILRAVHVGKIVTGVPIIFCICCLGNPSSNGILLPWKGLFLKHALYNFDEFFRD